MIAGGTRFHGFDVDRAGEVAIIRLDNAQTKNALDLATKRELAEVVFALNLDGETRAILITGAHGAFSAGDDLSRRPVVRDDEVRLSPGLEPYVREPIHTFRVVRSVTQHLMRTILESDLPTVAAIDGVAIQSGLTLALACDLRVASSSSRLASGTLRFGMLPDEGGHHLLVQYLGVAKAMQFVLLADFVSGTEAHGLGLVHETVDGSSFERALELATRLADAPAAAVRLSKRAIRRAAETTLEQSFETIALSAAISDYDADMATGGAAFRNKAPATFRRFIARDDVRDAGV